METNNMAAMRKALEYLRDASREFCHLILNSKYNEVFDKYKYAEVAKIRDAIANANAALSAPARNCDRDLSDRRAIWAELRQWVHTTSCGCATEPSASDAFEWLLAPATEGGAK